MAPRTRALFGAPRDFRIIIKLVIPNYIEVGAVVDLIKRRPQRVVDAIAGTTVTLLKRMIIATCVDELLTERAILPDLSAEDTDALRATTATRKCCSIKLEREPPIDRLPPLEKRNGSLSREC